MTVDVPRAGRPKPRPSRWRVGACLAVLGGLLVGAAPPGTSSGPAYGARPAHHGDSDLAAMSYAHAVEVDVVLQDAVEVLNFTREPATFEVYTADLIIDAAGNRAPAARSVAVTGPGSWITLASSRIDLAARSSELVDFTIQVPVGTPPGEYAAALLVERDVDIRGDGVVSRTRISLPIDLEVLGEIDLAVELGALSAVRDGRDVRFELAVTNTGNVTFDATGRVAIGEDAQAPVEQVSLLPSPRVMAPAATAPLAGVWEDAPWFGRITAHPIIEARVGERTPLIVVGDPITVWLVPWWQLITVGVVLALVLTWLIATRDRRRQWFADRQEERALVHDLRHQRRVERQRVPTG